MTKKPQELLHRAETWLEEAQEELVELGREIEGEINGEYQASPEEIDGIDRGLAAADSGIFASEADVKTILGKFRVA